MTSHMRCVPCDGQGDEQRVQGLSDRIVGDSGADMSGEGLGSPAQEGIRGWMRQLRGGP